MCRSLVLVKLDLTVAEARLLASTATDGGSGIRQGRPCASTRKYQLLLAGQNEVRVERIGRSTTVLHGRILQTGSGALLVARTRLRTPLRILGLLVGVPTVAVSLAFMSVNPLLALLILLAYGACAVARAQTADLYEREKLLACLLDVYRGHIEACVCSWERRSGSDTCA